MKEEHAQKTAPLGLARMLRLVLVATNSNSLSIINNNNNNNNNDVIIKLIKNVKSKYFLLPALSSKRMGLLKKKIYISN